MQSRRTLTKMGFASLITLVGSRATSIAAQTPETFTMDEMEFEYQGMLAVSNLPELPTAPDGECAVILQRTGDDSSILAIFHNASEETVHINRVSGTATNEQGHTDTSVQGQSLHAPRTLDPGDYGIAVLEFPERRQTYTDELIELEVVPKSELDPAMVTMPVTEVHLVNPRSGNSMNMQVQNRSQETLEEDSSGFVGTFFGPDGEPAYWFVSTFRTDTEPGEERWISHASTSMVLTDSFMIGFSGQVLE